MKKLLVEILQFILNILKWLVFSNVAIYAASRVAMFLSDPYMEHEGTGFYRDDLLVMFAQATAFTVIAGLVISMYKILFKQNYKWQTIVTFIVTLVIVLMGVCLLF